MVYIFCPGIMSVPGVDRSWNKRACTWINCNTQHKADLYLYLVGPITRALGVNRRARNLASIIEQYLLQRHEVVLVGHSNGANVINNALGYIEPSLMKKNPVRRVALFSPALDRKLERTQLYKCFVDWQVQNISIYVAGNDQAMKWARWGQWLGYGDLGAITQEEFEGYTGPRGEYTHASSYGHSGWFWGDRFEHTMKSLLP